MGVSPVTGASHGGRVGVPVPRPDVDVEALRRALARHVQGEVRFADGDRALYATDASNYREVPVGVVVPRSVDDIIATVGVARAHGVPILTRGGGTALAGQTCNAALLLDASKYVNRVLEVDAANRRARVEPGLVLDELRKATAPHGLTFGPDPATHSRCTLGGMIGNNSCGVHSVMAEFYGPGAHTMHQVESLDVLTYDGTRLTVGPTSDIELARLVREGGRRGEIYAALARLRDRYADEIRRRWPKGLVRRASGYNLDQLLPEHGFHVARALVGTESTCVTVLGATVTLIEAQPHRALLVLGYPTVEQAGHDVPRMRELKPVALEGMDDLLVTQMRENHIHVDALQLMPSGHGFLLVEFGGRTADEARERAERARAEIARRPDTPDLRLYDDAERQQKIWEVREAGLGATAFVPGQPDAWPGWEDASVPPERVGEYLRDFRALLDRYGLHCALYGHFGQGCVHCRISFDLYSAQGVAAYAAFTREAAELACGKYGGSLSGEHGDGQARADLLPIMFGETLVQAFAEFKAIWDPDGRMNPGKVVRPHGRTDDLRLGPHYEPAQPVTHFAYPQDRGSFARATLRCVGVGLCRRHEGGTMCPSYMVTREERHSTRGRTHLLFEMLQGQVVRDGWKSEAVKEALDLCLACKGCKGDCPVHVDVATYKAEFLSHYYDGRLRPRHAYAFGLIDRWSRLASHLPRLANLATHAPGLERLAKWAADVAPQRTIPRFAPRPFTRWYRARHARPPEAPARRVLLWPDTFNNHFFPGTLAAAAEVLTHAGYAVVLPPEGLCCGRPLYDYGMLDRAKRYLRRVLRALREEIERGTPLVGLEPSCVSVFRDELRDLFPHDEDAKRLGAQARTLGELLQARCEDGWQPPRLEAAALLHGHCHHKSVLTFTGERQVLEAMGLDVDAPETGCCGMAGAFGFERAHYDVAIAAGERVLLPAVRQAGRDTLVVADGFSCREQVAQTTDRRALHLAEVLQLALRGDAWRRGEPPEAASARCVPRELAWPPGGHADGHADGHDHRRHDGPADGGTGGAAGEPTTSRERTHA
ncbi:MAG TPA: FAD-binding and (Fe-S)-binding domain-containing protein [Gemmatimonadaceae bacterium]|nr:FAD-binding and (Fe-S)-binding domain-containing protein [Gemmatimonadaceae bacterium]